MSPARDRGGLGWKLASVVLAYLFWLAVIEERQAYRQIEVALRFERVPPGLALRRDRPSSVVVRVKASEARIREVSVTDIDAIVDLAGFTEGKHVIPFSAASPHIVSKRSGIAVDEVFPAAVEVVLEPKRTAEVTVRAIVTGRPASGLVAGEPRVEPRRVKIEGPASAVDAVSEAITQEVSIAGAEADVVAETRLEVADAEVTVLGASRARVVVPVRDVSGERSFADLPIVATGSEHESRLRPEATQVTLGGPERLLAALVAADVRVFVDLSGLKPGARPYSLPVRVEVVREGVRDRVSVKRVGDETVSVRVLAQKQAG